MTEQRHDDKQGEGFKADYGPWRMLVSPNEVTLYSYAFHHDAAIMITGDFATQKDRIDYATNIMERLSAPSANQHTELLRDLVIACRQYDSAKPGSVEMYNACRLAAEEALKNAAAQGRVGEAMLGQQTPAKDGATPSPASAAPATPPSIAEMDEKYFTPHNCSYRNELVKLCSAPSSIAPSMEQRLVDAEECCIDIYHGMTELTAKTMPESVWTAWRLGQQLVDADVSATQRSEQSGTTTKGAK